MSAAATRRDANKQALAQLASIREMVHALRCAVDAHDDTAQDAAQQTIHEDALSVEVRCGWRSIGEAPDAPEEYRILLCTGGPAVRIIGELNEHCEPVSARLEAQGWFIPWQEVRRARPYEDALLAYARCFYFGDA